MRAEAAAQLERTIDACAGMGVGTILAPLTENDDTRAEPDEQQRDRWVELLSSAGWRADERGVDLCLEACARPYACTAEHVLELAQRSGAAGVGGYYDPGNAVAAGLDPAAEIRALGGRLKAFHVKDSGGRHLGEGEVDFPGVIAALRENGYSGPLVLETPRGDDARASAARNLEFTRTHFNG